MALSLGWRANDLRESIWVGDPSLGEVPESALDAWREDGDASHLLPFATKGEPTTICFRALTADERPFVLAPMIGSENDGDRFAGRERSTILAFRIGCSFKGSGDSAGTDPGTGAKRKIIINEKGIRMIASAVIDDLQSAYPGLVPFYGNLILNASFLTDAEKKASSPPSIPTPSSAAVSTTDTTAPSPPAEAVTGAP